MTATEPQRPPPSVLLGVFLLSAAVLALEVALTRLFSAVLRYHYVFLVVSVAVCGLGVGGMLVHTVSRLRALTLSRAASVFGLSALGFIVALFKLILPRAPDALWLIALLILVPFTCAGMFLAIAFREHAQSAGLLYAYDLIGAACAAVGVIAAMQVLGAINGCMLGALLACLAGLLTLDRRTAMNESLKSWPDRSPIPQIFRYWRIERLSVLVVLVALKVNIKRPWLDIPPIPSHNSEYAKPLYAELADPTVGSKIIHTEWDAFARTDVVKDPQAGEDVLLVYTNGHVPTNITRFDAETGRHRIPSLVGEVPFAWRPPRRVLCIGPGAGLDLLLAKRAGAERVDGIEVNPAIPRIVRLPRFRAFGGDPYGLPGVNVRVGDGRTFVLRSRAQYDLIFMALTKTATSSAGVALVEGYLYTEEAFRDYLARLAPRGQLVLVTDGFPFNVRLMITALHVLMQQGKSLDEAQRQVALLSVPPEQMGFTPYQFALVVSKSPIDRAEADRLFRATRRAGYQEVFIPGEAALPPFDQLGAGTLTEFAARVSDMLQMRMHISQRRPLNLAPVTDDRPFFLDLTFGVPPMILPLLAGTMIALMAITVLVLVQGRRARGSALRPLDRLSALGYFSCLGVGFMLVEIPLMQKLILVLGHPTLALTVVLAALLLGGGIGSALSQRWRVTKGPMLCGAVAIMVGVYAVYLRSPSPSVLALPLTARILWAAGLSGALGLVLGMPFPMGIRALSPKQPDDVPAMWGVNGLTSVIGSLLAAMGAKLYGFQAVMLGGALVYLGAAVLAWPLTRAGILPEVADS